MSSNDSKVGGAFGKVNIHGPSDEDDGVSRRVGSGISFASPQTFHPVPVSASRSAFVSTSVPKSNDLSSDTSTKQMWKLNASKYVWKLKEVPGLPECHTLEKTAVFIPNASPSVISERISTVLRDLSIEAFYDDDKAKVKCISPDGVDFRVRLYRGRGKFNHGIIAEVQRRFGASLNFHDETMAILDSAEGKSVAPPPPSFGGNCLPLVSDSEDEQSSTVSLEGVEKMFMAPTLDTQSLGYQILTPLSDSTRCGEKTARAVARTLLEPDSVVGNKVLALVLDKRGEDELFKLRTAAMTVLANAVQAVKGDVSIHLREQLQPVLIDELRQAQKSPRLAVQAARCVEMLLQKNEQADADMHPALIAALEVGVSRHAGLEQQVKKCLSKIP